jgi:hypothetical protein
MTKTREILVKACTLKPGDVVLGPNGWIKISRLCLTSEKVEIQPGDFSRESDYDIWLRKG